jgi:hypothetical protein
MDKQLLAEFLSNHFNIDSPNIDKLLEMEDVYKEIYQKYRINLSFGEAKVKSYLGLFEFLESENTEES